jgi:hypothetical protein
VQIGLAQWDRTFTTACVADLGIFEPKNVPEENWLRSPVVLGNKSA